MNKKILPAYYPPKLVKGATAYYIKVYAKSKKNKQLERFRKTFNINRILHLRERAKRGNELVDLITVWLKAGKYFEDFDEIKAIKMQQEQSRGVELEKVTMLLVDAIDLAMKVKLSRTNKRASKRTIESHVRLFRNYLEKKDKLDLMLHEFTAREAHRYADYWITELGITNGNSYNNRLICIKGYFNILLDREYIAANPFRKVKPIKVFKSGKDNFTLEEMPIMLDAAKERNKWLWVAMQLAFWGGVRQEEMSRLRFRHFDTTTWCIRWTSDITKNGKEDVTTLPMFLKTKFLEIGFFEQPINYYVFGEHLLPGTVMINEHTLYKQHFKVLKKMYKEKKVEERKGLSFSSWRRTGMKYIVDRLPPRKAQEHFRHEDWETTEKYMPNRSFIPEVSQLSYPF
ncbi:MAG: tyrosine-type recombinase/integrase [Bacteroidota bacterium]